MEAGTTWYMNGADSLGLSYEKQIKTNGLIEHKHYLSAGGEVFAQFTRREGVLGGKPAKQVSYFHHDHLGSLSAITNDQGEVIERLAYDPWGKRRFANGLKDSNDTLTSANTKRGFTMHEHMDEMGVINMNGRVYDPLIGRFLSADPFVKNPYLLSSFNRYSYVNNNPLTNTDPTGYFSIKRLFNKTFGGSGSGQSSSATVTSANTKDLTRVMIATPDFSRKGGEKVLSYKYEYINAHLDRGQLPGWIGVDGVAYVRIESQTEKALYVATELNYKQARSASRNGRNSDKDKGDSLPGRVADKIDRATAAREAYRDHYKAGYARQMETEKTYNEAFDNPDLGINTLKAESAIRKSNTTMNSAIAIAEGIFEGIKSFDPAVGAAAVAGGLEGTKDAYSGQPSKVGPDIPDSDPGPDRAADSSDSNDSKGSSDD
jgi:RHS repeat-associated protein